MPFDAKMSQAFADQLDYDAVQSLYDNESMYTPAGKELLKKCLICFGIINPFDVGYHLQCCKTAYIHDVCHRRRNRTRRGKTVGATNRGTKRLYRRLAKVDDGQRCPHCRKPNAMLVKFTDHMQYMDRVKVNCPVDNCNKLMTSVELLQHYSQCTLENMAMGGDIRQRSQVASLSSSTSEGSNKVIDPNDPTLDEEPIPLFDDAEAPVVEPEPNEDRESATDGTAQRSRATSSSWSDEVIDLTEECTDVVDLTLDEDPIRLFDEEEELILHFAGEPNEDHESATDGTAQRLRATSSSSSSVGSDELIDLTEECNDVVDMKLDDSLGLMDLINRCQNGNGFVFDDGDEMVAWNLQKQEFASICA